MRRSQGQRIVLLLTAVVLWLPATSVVAAGNVDQVVLAPGSFLDDNGSVHQTNIEALAAANITKGCNPPDNNRYCPDEPTTRAEMATLLARALDLPATDVDHFSDDTGLVHEANINALAAAGITSGCNPPENNRYCPAAETTRAQMATFLVRAIDIHVPQMWQLVHDAGPDEIQGSSYAWHLAHGDLGYVAAGRVLAVEKDAAVWTSPDGHDWTYVPNTNGVFGGPGNEISVNGVAVGAGAMIAVGSWSATSSSFDTDAAVWRSTDRTSWVKVPQDATVFGDPGTDHQSMNGVVFHQTIGFVAVGGDSEFPGHPDEIAETVAAVWTSKDGLAWTRVADSTGSFAGARTQRMTRIVATADMLVAAGSDYGTGSPAFWWSLDGEDWYRTPDPDALPLAEGVAVKELTAGPSGFVAIIYESFKGGSGGTVTYTSLDGRSWTRHAVTIDGTISGVTHDGDSYIAVGLASQAHDYRPSIWESPDGITWSRIGERSSGPTSRWSQTVLATPVGLLIGGTTKPAGPLHGAIWLRP